MRITGPGACSFVLCLLLVTSAPAGAVLGVDGPSGDPSDANFDRSDVVQTITFRLAPERPNVVEATVTYDVGSGVTELRPVLHEMASVKPSTDHPGFEATSDGGLRWDGRTRHPSFTILYNVKQADHTGRVSSAATERWALFGSDAVYTRFRAYGDPELTRRVRVDGPGYATDAYTFLGEHETHNFTLEGTDVTFVVPAESTVTEEDVARVERTLAHAAAFYEPSSRARTMTLFTAMSPIRKGGQAKGPRGDPEYGEEAMWVHESTLAAAGGQSVLVHEYVHTQQSFATRCDMGWFVEGSAEYYASLTTLRRGNRSYARFHDSVTDDRYDDVVLTEQCEYSRAQYSKGARALAALDLRIRNATDGERTLQDVMVAVNRRDGALTYDAFADVVERVADESMDAWLARHVARPAPARVPMNSSLYFGPNDDNDDDGLTRSEERSLGSDPDVADTDTDSLSDGEEAALGGDPTAADTDGDGLFDPHERDLGTDLTVEDTDGDGLDDGNEWRRDEEIDPTVEDTDGDGLTDGEETSLDALYQSDPTVADTDDDGLPDGEEVELETDPTESDTDGDGRVDGDEVAAGTDPLRPPDPISTALEGVERYVASLLERLGA